MCKKVFSKKYVFYVFILTYLAIANNLFCMQENKENTSKDICMQENTSKDDVSSFFLLDLKSLEEKYSVYSKKCGEFKNKWLEVEEGAEEEFYGTREEERFYYGEGVNFSLDKFKKSDEVLKRILEFKVKSKNFELYTKCLSLKLLRFKKRVESGVQDFLDLIKNFDGTAFKKEFLNLDDEHMLKNIKEILCPEDKKMFVKRSISTAIRDGVEYFDSLMFVIMKLKNQDKGSIGDHLKNSIFMKLKNPELYFFSECGCIPREKRSEFENKVVNCENLEKFETINYLGFAPGDLYPDLRILIELIVKKKKKINTIYLVDIYYKGIDLNKKDFGEYTPIEFLKVITLLQFIKILSEFQVKEGGEPIKLQIYSDLASYIEYCSKDAKLKANLATIMDLNAGPPDYTGLLFIRDEIKQDNQSLFYGRAQLEDQKGRYEDIFMTKVELVDKIHKKGLQEGGVLFEL